MCGNISAVTAVWQRLASLHQILATLGTMAPNQGTPDTHRVGTLLQYMAD